MGPNACQTTQVTVIPERKGSYTVDFNQYETESPFCSKRVSFKNYTTKKKGLANCKLRPGYDTPMRGRTLNSLNLMNALAAL